MTKRYNLSMQVRSDMGKGASRRLRRTEMVPAILYGAGLTPQNLMLQHKVLQKALEDEGFYSHILHLEIEGKTERAILKDLQRHPFKRQILHADFQRISEKEKLTMSIPLHFIGEKNSPGVQQGGLVSHHLIDVEIHCLPGDLPEFIEVDVSGLEMDESLHLSAIKVPKNVELVALQHGNDQTLVSIHMPRAAEEEPSSAPEAIEAPPVIGEDKSESAEGAKSTKE